MLRRERTIYEGDTGLEHYQVVDMVYGGRPARVLFTDRHRAAQSGIARDSKIELLFDYNQRFFELATSIKPGHMLIIGGGTYTLPMALLQSLPHASIDVVEIDPQLDDIAEQFFGLISHPRLTIIHDTGQHYLDTTLKNYDLILVDAFIGTEIPHEFLTLETTLTLQSRLTKQGLVAINAIDTYSGRSMRLKNLLAAYQKAFRHVSMYPADESISLLISQNFIVLGQKSGHSPYHIKSSSLPLPKTTAHNILSDNSKFYS